MTDLNLNFPRISPLEYKADAARCVAAAGVTADGPTFWVLNFREDIVKWWPRARPWLCFIITLVAAGADIVAVRHHYGGGRRSDAENKHTGAKTTA